MCGGIRIELNFDVAGNIRISTYLYYLFFPPSTKPPPPLLPPFFSHSPSGSLLPFCPMCHIPYISPVSSASAGGDLGREGGGKENCGISLSQIQVRLFTKLQNTRSSKGKEETSRFIGRVEYAVAMTHLLKNCFVGS